MTREHKKIWDAEKRKVRRLVDGVGMPVDRHIVETVAILRLMGFKTHMSCGGHVDRARGPWVSFRPRQADTYSSKAHGEDDSAKTRRYWRLVEKYNAREMQRLLPYLVRFYENRQVPYERQLIVQGFGRLRYDLTTLDKDLIRLVDKTQRRAHLDRQRQEFRDFTEFLKADFFGT
ncbi:hypothetical protein ACFY4I_27890 [Streptomyces scabiei]|uniref:hypothetical protein n=1 Tax=Streptomyces scabiei TaxID=1930 RepID=UPI0036CDA9B0